MKMTLGGLNFASKFHAVFYGPCAELLLHTQIQNQVYGQIKVNNYKTDDNASGETQTNFFCDLSKSSILHSFLTSGAAGAGTLNLQYYIRHK